MNRTFTTQLTMLRALADEIDERLAALTPAEVDCLPAARAAVALADAVADAQQARHWLAVAMDLADATAVP